MRFFLVFLIACGGTGRTADGLPKPKPETAAALDACGTCGDGTRCFLTEGTGKCFAAPPKVCDAPSCECFQNDPCAANQLGTCSGYDHGVPSCRR